MGSPFGRKLMALAQQPEIQLATAGDRIGWMNGVGLNMRILGKCSLEVGLVKFTNDIHCGST